MYEKDLVSIIVPVYNVEPYLPRCIGSLLAQTYSKLEIILVDDGSTDNCPELCDRYAAQDDRIRVIHQENGGIANARNVGLAAVSGEFMTYVDSDDWIDETFVEKLLELLKENHADMATCYELWTGDTEARIQHSEEQVNVYDTEQALEALLYQKEFDVGPHGKLYRTQVCKPHRYPVGMQFEDLGTTYKIVADCKKVVSTNQQYYYYFQSPNSITRSAFDERRLAVVTLMDEQFAFLMARFPGLEKAACARKFAAYCYILRQLPDEEKWRELRDRLWSFVRSYRVKMILDSKARMKNRLAGVCACLGLAVLRKF